jgi:CBS domain-containing protein
MSTVVFGVSTDEPLDAALDVMLSQNVRHVPVLDDEGRVVGIVSHRDLLAAGGPRTDDAGGLGALASALAERTVGEVMSTPDTVEPETAIDEVARILRDNQYGCVPVVENERLVGIVTEADFVRAIADGVEEEEEA